MDLGSAVLGSAALGSAIAGGAALGSQAGVGANGAANVALPVAVNAVVAHDASAHIRTAEVSAARAGGQITAVPVGGVEAGDKGISDDSSNRGVLLGTALLLAAATGGSVAAMRNRRKS
ncbi:hypothetical protein P9209_25120 [Prescottella defluvii]|nr:hypothetical protein P9209_25120 [Prescottella defluvii]